MQDADTPAGSGPQTVEELRAQLDEFQAARAWTEQQHQRWMQERAALLETVRRLRERVSVPEDLVAAQERAMLQASNQSLKAWNEELEKAKAWFLQQLQAAEEERKLLLRNLEQCTARNAELEKAKAAVDRPER